MIDGRVVRDTAGGDFSHAVDGRAVRDTAGGDIEAAVLIDGCGIRRSAFHDGHFVIFKDDAAADFATGDGIIHVEVCLSGRVSSNHEIWNAA